MGLGAREYRRISETLDIVTSESEERLARGDTGLLQFEIDDFLKSHGVNLRKDSLAHKQVSYSFLRAFVKAMELKERSTFVGLFRILCRKNPTRADPLHRRLPLVSCIPKKVTLPQAQIGLVGLHRAPPGRLLT